MRVRLRVRLRVRVRDGEEGEGVIRIKIRGDRCRKHDGTLPRYEYVVQGTEYRVQCTRYTVLGTRPPPHQCHHPLKLYLAKLPLSS